MPPKTTKAMRPKKCRYCGGLVLWTKGPKGGDVPVDAEPSDDGTVALQEMGGVLYGGSVTRGQAAGMRAAGRKLHQPHRFTCLQKDMWVKAKDKEPRFRGKR